MRFLKNKTNNNSKSESTINGIKQSRDLSKNLRLKIAGTFLALFVLASCACEMDNPMTGESSIGTNIDIARTIISNDLTQVWHQTNFTSSNEENAVIHYNTGGGFTNIFLRYILTSIGLSNYLAETNMEVVVTTNDVITTNILSNVESSFLMTNISNTFTNVPLRFITNYFTNYVGIAGTNTVTNTDWSDFDFSGANLTNLNLTNYNFAGANLMNANLMNANLMNANLSGAIILGATTNGINFTGADLTAALIDLDKTLAMDGADADNFGWSVSVSGDTAIVGSYRDDDNGSASGSAYIFTRSGTDWSQQAKITPNDGSVDGFFGYSVSVSGDTVIVGSQLDDDNGTNSGSAYIFTRTGTDWSQQAKITPNDGAEADLFGISVSVSGDTVIVGSYQDDDNGAGSGSAYIFTRTGTDWSQQAKITPNDGAEADLFGISVSVSGDTVIVGSYQDDDNGAGSGSAYIFTRTGGTWSQQAKITPGDGAEADLFGISVSVSGDTAIVGSYQDDDNGRDSGSAYIFTRSGTDWSQQAKITPNDGATDDNFGYSVSVSGDTVIVGSRLDDDNGRDSGSAYVFTRSGSNWTPTKITPNDGAEADNFGYSVSVSGDTVIVGSYLDDDNGSASGSAYVFEFGELP